MVPRPGCVESRLPWDTRRPRRPRHRAVGRLSQRPGDARRGAGRRARAAVRWGRREADRGAATAELVMVLPMLVAVTLGLVWLLSVGSAQLRAVDAARETARAVARGDDTATAVGRGQQVGPTGTRVEVSAGGSQVVATATATVDGPGGLFRWLPGVTLHARAVATTEEAP